MSKGILYDATKCIGCKQCEQACAAENGLPYDDKIAAQEVTSAHKYTAVLTKDDKFMRRLCMNCEDPACASVCPVGALKKTALGPVTYDKSKCMGCRYCMAACPFGVPKYEWEKAVPGVRKCIMCSQARGRRKADGLRGDLPDRRDHLRRPRRPAGRGQEANPRQSRQVPASHLRRDRSWRDVGHVAVVDVAFNNFGFATDLTERALPLYTYQVLSRIPDFVPLFGTMLGGIYWITHRREDVAEAEAEKENEFKGGAR